HQPTAARRDPSPRLALEDIIDLTLINSREYQTQKETLYRVALRLSLERFDYEMKFSTSGNRTAANYSHTRDGGETINSLDVPTTITSDKLLATGGALLARFANDVVLTFNGPQGFAADVGSELLLEISQSVFQRDIAFESLTQAERDVVYAARDFARFRKRLFRDQASQYYALVLAYRGIEIDTQDYFTNLRAYNQGEAEYRAGQRSRVEVDQVEQSVLTGRSRLIGSCDGLERSLDSLKVSIGLPPELPLNLDLTELELLTLRDEATVSAERVRRARRNLLSERRKTALDRDTLLRGAVDLTGRMLDLHKSHQRLGRQLSNLKSLELLHSRLNVDEARALIHLHRTALRDAELQSNSGGASEDVSATSWLRGLRRNMNLADSFLRLVGRQLELAEGISADRQTAQKIRA
ncbi:hypothetical protein LCGC14_2794700, partial [marine sediment metagenome]